LLISSNHAKTHCDNLEVEAQISMKYATITFLNILKNILHRSHILRLRAGSLSLTGALPSVEDLYLSTQLLLT